MQQIKYLLNMKYTKLKITKTIFFVTLIMSFYSCKKEIKTPVNNTNKETKEVKSLQEETKIHDNLFVIKMIAKIKNDDYFRVYYGYDGEKFEEKRVVLVKVKGGEENQEIVFNFPPMEIPEKFRIHLGKGNKNEEIQIKQILLTYNESQFIIDKNNFNNYFNTSSSLEFNALNSTLLPLNNDSGIYDPHFVSNKELGQVIINF